MHAFPLKSARVDSERPNAFSGVARSWDVTFKARAQSCGMPLCSAFYLLTGSLPYAKPVPFTSMLVFGRSGTLKHLRR